jgi:Spirocyclase AveC-like
MATELTPTAGRPTAFGARAPAPAERAPGPPPVKIWAFFGAIALAFILFVWIKWVTGPYFKAVAHGPDVPPGWMRAFLHSYQVFGAVVLLSIWYWVAWRPRQRDGAWSSDGLLVLALPFTWFQDPLSNWFGPWYTVNSYTWNLGSWTNEIPGWMWPGEPRHVIAEPPLFNGCFYVYAIFGFSVAACWAMRKASNRRPQWGPLRLLAVSYAVTFMLDVILEGFVWMPLGIYTYPGAPGPALFPNSYHKFPLLEPTLMGLLITMVAALRYFKDDNGNTRVERGIEKIHGKTKQTTARYLAMIAATQLALMLGFNAPAIVFTSHPTQWPKATLERSYFTDFLCGQGTDRACPAKGIPIPRGNGSGHVAPNGTYVPPHSAIPKPVPFNHNRTELKPFNHGPVIGSG